MCSISHLRLDTIKKVQKISSRWRRLSWSRDDWKVSCTWFFRGLDSFKTDDPKAIYQHVAEWGEFLNWVTTPVFTDEEAGQIIAEINNQITIDSRSPRPFRPIFYLGIQNKLIFPLYIRSRLNFKALIIFMSSTFYIVHNEFKVGKAKKPWPND